MKTYNGKSATRLQEFNITKKRVLKPPLSTKKPHDTTKQFSLANTHKYSLLPMPKSTFTRFKALPRQSVSSKQLLAKSPFPNKNYVAKCTYKTQTGSKHGRSKKNNQDSFLILPHILNNKAAYLFGVFDGHGPLGHIVSAHCKQSLSEHIRSEFSPELKDSLKKSIQKTVKSVESSGTDLMFSGSTLVVILIYEGNLTCGNIGDSRAVLGSYLNRTWKSQDLSRDHKPDLIEERIRIISAGGKVNPSPSFSRKTTGPDRVWLMNENTPGLAMSRSIGDALAHSVGVSSKPDFISLRLTQENRFVIVASDGLWEVVSSQEAVEIVGRSVVEENTDDSCHVLANIATKRWVKTESAVDDLTIIIVFFM